MFIYIYIHKYICIIIKKKKYNCYKTPSKR